MRKRNGFTLIELLVVISIVALLIALLLPAIEGATEAARQGVCQSNMRQQALVMAGYQADHEDYFAPGWSFGGPGSSHKSPYERLESYGIPTHDLPVVGYTATTQLFQPFSHGKGHVWICPSDPGASVERGHHPQLGGWYHHGFYHFGDDIQYHVSYALNTMNFVYVGVQQIEDTVYGLYSLYDSGSRRVDQVPQPAGTMMFVDGSITRSWSFWVPYVNTSVEQECFHYGGITNLVAVDGHAQSIDCEPSDPAYIIRTPWAVPERWYRVDE